MRWLTDSWWKFVFWWKKRTGFIAFFPVTAAGTVLSLRSSSDGDALLNIELYGDYLNLTPELIGDYTHHGRLHCELPPWIRGEVRDVYAQVKVGDRVEVSGEWGFDGVHLFEEKKWWLFPLEVLAAIFRHQPNVRDGWFELHPVTEIKILGGAE
jgi:hypothetical protein